MTTHTLSDEDWAERVRAFGTLEHAAAAEKISGDGNEAIDPNADPDEPMAEPVHLDPANPDPDADLDLDLDLESIDSENSDRPQRFDRRIAWGFSGLVVAAVIATLIAAVGLYSPHDPTPAPGTTADARPVAIAPTTAPPAPAPAPAPSADRPLPYTADAQGSCAPGSTPAQTMSGADPRNAFVCVRSGGDGQTLTLDLGRTYVVTAIALTPGWVGLDASGVSQWSQHRVVTLVQYQFDDPDRTLVTQDTRNVHGEAVQPVKHVLASKVRLLIRQTSRPPTEPQQSVPAPDGTGLLPGVFGDAVPTPFAPVPSDGLVIGPAGNDDPVDATFAISSLKIIGHEAV